MEHNPTLSIESPRPGGSPAAPPARQNHRPRVHRASEAPGGLPAFHHYRPQPGHPDWPRLAEEARALAEQLRPGLAQPERGARRHRRIARAYRTAARNYLDNRALSRAGREDLRPLYFIWTLLRSCNFLCKYCDDHRGRKYPELSNEGVLDTTQAFELLRIMRSRTPSVYFSGGEPTLRQDLPAITAEAHRLAYYPIIINTNGSLLHRWLKRDHWRSWLAQMDIIVVSLDSLDLRALSDLWVYPKSEDVLLNLLLLRELSAEQDVKLMVNSVIQPGQTREARAVLNLCNDLGITFCPVPLNEGPTVSREVLVDQDYRELKELILQRKRAGYPISGSERLLRRLLSSAPLRCRNTLKPHVDYDGALVWPCKSCQNVTPEHIKVLDFPDVDALYAHACTQIDPTGFHGPAKNQCGANCNWAQNYSTDCYAHGLDHPLSLVSTLGDFLRR